MRSSKILCTAKINPFLSVGPPDPNGYHPIRTVLQQISLADELEIAFADSGSDSVTSNWSALPADNTLTKVLKLARELLDVPPLQIHLQKVIPTEAGLGGGSTNAAGLLRWLAQCLPAAFPPHTLRDIAFAVGADVPFFLMGGRCQAQGYGEQLIRLPDLPKQHLVIAKPIVGCSTGPAYMALDKIPRQWKEFPTNPLELYNDFEKVMPRECLEVKEALLSAGCGAALLSGSGSAVFGQAESSNQARSIADRLGGLISGTFVVVAESIASDG